LNPFQSTLHKKTVETATKTERINAVKFLSKTNFFPRKEISAGN